MHSTEYDDRMGLLAMINQQKFTEYKDEVFFYCKVLEWCKCFKEDRVSINADPCSGDFGSPPQMVIQPV